MNLFVCYNRFICLDFMGNNCNNNKSNCKYYHPDICTQYIQFSKCNKGTACRLAHVKKINENNNSLDFPIINLNGRNILSFDQFIGNLDNNFNNSIISNRQMIIYTGVLFDKSKFNILPILINIFNNISSAWGKTSNGNSLYIAQDAFYIYLNQFNNAKLINNIFTYFKLLYFSNNHIFISIQSIYNFINMINKYFIITYNDGKMFINVKMND